MSEEHGMGRKRGPYGTNEGDKWLVPGSELQDMLDARDEGKVIVMEMMIAEGEEEKGLQECMYVLLRDNPDTADLLAEAERGHELYVAALAARN